MLKSVVVSVGLSLICHGASAQAPTLSAKIITLQEQTDDLYRDTTKILPSVMRSGNTDDNTGIDAVFELDGKLSSNLNHLYSLQLLLESSSCPSDRALINNLKSKLVRYMATMIDGDFGPIYVGKANTHNLNIMSIYSRLEVILKAERTLLDEVR